MNIRTLIEVIERDACSLQDGVDKNWHVEAIRSRAKTISRLSAVLLDEVTRADAMHDRLCEMTEACHA